MRVAPSASQGSTLPATTTSTSTVVKTTAGSTSVVVITSPTAAKMLPTTTAGMISARPARRPTTATAPAIIAPAPAAATG